MTKMIRARIRGRTIELTEGPGLNAGTEVVITVRAVQATEGGRFASEGALADDDDWDDIMEEVQRDRRADVRHNCSE